MVKTWENTVSRLFKTFSGTCIFFLLTLSLLWSSSFSLSLLWIFPPLLCHLSILLEVWFLIPLIICLGITYNWLSFNIPSVRICQNMRSEYIICHSLCSWGLIGHNLSDTIVSPAWGEDSATRPSRLMMDYCRKWRFPKIGVPPIIHFNGIFHYELSILGYPH